MLRRKRADRPGIKRHHRSLFLEPLEDRRVLTGLPVQFDAFEQLTGHGYIVEEDLRDVKYNNPTGAGPIAVGHVDGSTPPDDQFYLALLGQDGLPLSPVSQAFHGFHDFNEWDPPTSRQDVLEGVAVGKTTMGDETMFVAVGHTCGGLTNNCDFAILSGIFNADQQILIRQSLRIDLFEAGQNDQAYDVVYDALDRIIVVGWSEADGERDFAVMRLVKNQFDEYVPDTTFGTNGNGVVITDLGSLGDEAHGVEVDTWGGRINVGGFVVKAPPGDRDDFAWVRYSENGQVELTRFVTFGDLDRAYDLALDSQQRVILAGWTSVGQDFAVARFINNSSLATDGQLDTSFSGDGLVTTDFGGNEVGDSAFGYGVQVHDPFDRITVVGKTTAPIGTGDNGAIVRYLENGWLDLTFGVQRPGRMYIDFTHTHFDPDNICPPPPHVTNELLAGVGIYEAPYPMLFEPGLLAIAGRTDNEQSFSVIPDEDKSGTDHVSGTAFVIYPEFTSDPQPPSIGLRIGRYLAAERQYLSAAPVVDANGFTDVKSVHFYEDTGTGLRFIATDSTPHDGFEIEVDGLRQGRKFVAIAVDKNGLSSPPATVTEQQPPGPSMSVRFVQHQGELNFGTVDLGDPPPTREIIIENPGEADLIIYPGAVPAGFSAVPPLPSQIVVPPCSSITLTFQMETTPGGEHVGLMTFFSNAAHQPIFEFTMRGMVRVPEVAVTGNNLDIPDGDTTPTTLDGTDFGTVLQGSTPIVHTFVVHNTGFKVLTIQNITLPVGFSFVVAPNFPTELDSQNELFLQVQLDTNTSGVKSGNIQITSDDEDEGEYTFTIKGRVDAASPEIRVTGKFDIEILDGDTTPTPADGTHFGSAYVNDPVPEQTFLIHNDGNVPLEVSEVFVSGDFEVLHQPPGSVQPNSPLPGMFAIIMQTTTAGYKEGIVSFTTNDMTGGENTFTFAVAGTVIQGFPEITLKGLGVTIQSGDTTPSSADGTDFGSVQLNAAPIIREFVIKNDGTAILTTADLAYPAGYSILDPLDYAIARNESDILRLQLDTTSSGTKSGNISFTTNDETDNERDFIFAITGVVVPPISFAPDIQLQYGYGPNAPIIEDGDTTPSLTDGTDFGSVAQGGLEPQRTFVVDNVGNQELDWQSIFLPPGFKVISVPVSPIIDLDELTLALRNCGSPGTRGGTVTIHTNDPDEEPFTFSVTGEVTVGTNPDVTVSGNGVNIPNTKINPQEADGTYFGAVALGAAPVARTFRVRNDGNEELHTSALSVPTGFTISTSDPLADIIPPGQYDDFTVLLNTAIVGEKSGSIWFNTNDCDEDPFYFEVYGSVLGAEVRVSGQGVIIANGSTTPNLYDGTLFDGAPQFGYPGSRTFSVYNPGNEELHTSGLTVTPGAGFSISTTNPLNAIIPARQSDTFTVLLDTATYGTKSATVSFNTNDQDDPIFTFAVAGNVLAKDIAVRWSGVNINDGDNTPSTADGTDFGSANQLEQGISRTFAVHNDGNIPLWIGSVTVPTGFTIVDPLGTYISGNSVDYLTVQMDTLVTGTKLGEITIYSDDPDEGMFNFAITGTVIGPDVVVLGNGYVILDGDLSPSYLDGTNFGTANINDAPIIKSFTVRNDGGAPLHITYTSLPGGFSFVNPLEGTIEPNSSDEFSVQMSTANPGILSGQITIDTNDLDELNYNFAITGTVTAPEVAVEGNNWNIVNGDSSPTTVDGTDFGSVGLGGDSVGRHFTVRNIGNGLLSTSGLTVPPGFTIVDSLNAAIVPPYLDTFMVRLDTATVGTKSGWISFSNNDVDENPFLFYVTGKVTGSEVAVSGNGLNITNQDSTPSIADGTDFGSVSKGGIGWSQTFHVNNSGNVALTTSGLTVPPGFSITEGLNPSIGAGMSDTFTVKLDSAVAGTKTGDITFNNNDFDEHPFKFTVVGIVTDPEVRVMGNGYEISDEDSTPGTHDGTDFGDVLISGTAVSRTFTVHNDGNTPLTSNGLTVPTGFRISASDPLAASIAPGQSDTFTVLLDTAVPGTKSGQISFATNDTNENPYNFSINGRVKSPDVAVLGLNYVVIHDGALIANTIDGTDFGTIERGGVPVSRVFYVVNEGNADLTTSGLSVPAGFTITDPLVNLLLPGASDYFRVQLDSAIPGTHSGPISFNNNDIFDENPFDFVVTGSVTVPEVVVQGNGIDISDGDTTPSTSDGTDFGAVSQGQLVTRSFTVRNTGLATLTTSGLSIVPGPGFSITDGLVSSIAGGGTDTITIQLNTATIGTKSGQIIFNNNDDNENPFDFSITAVVNGAEVRVTGNDLDIANYDFTPSTMDGTDFGSVTQGQAPIIRSFTVHNDGNIALTTSGLTVPMGYTVTDPLASSIPAGGSDIITVQLETASIGYKNGTIYFNSNDLDESLFNFGIVGIVTGPEVVVKGWGAWGTEITDGDDSPSTMDGTDFGGAGLGGTPVSRTFAVWNFGNADLSTSGFSVPDGFSVTEPLSGTIAPNTYDTFTVRLDSNSLGTKSGQIIFNNNDSDENPFNFSVTGIVSIPEVVVEWASIDISDGDTTPSESDGTDFGNAVFGVSWRYRTFIVRNIAPSGVLSTSGLTVPAGFTIIEGLSSSIAAGASDSFSVQLDNAVPGLKTGTIRFDNTDSDEDPFDFAIRGWVAGADVTVLGNGVAISDGDSTPSTLDGTDFGNATQLGAPVYQSFTVRNDGDADMSTSNLSVPTGFTVTDGLLSVIAPGASDTITVRMETSTLGIKSGELRFHATDFDESPFNFSITGIVRGPEIAVLSGGVNIVDGDTTPSSTDGTDFGTVVQGSAPVSRSFTVRNDGDDPLTTSGLDVPAGFTVIDGLATSIAPGTSDTITVLLDTVVPGVKTGQIVFSTNDIDENPFNFSITGTVNAPEVAVTGNGVNISDGDTTPSTSDWTDFGTYVQGGTPISRSFVVRNDGTAPLTTSGLSVPTGFTITDGLPVTIAAGASDTFTVRLDTAIGGNKSGQITFNNNDADEHPFNFSITGNVNIPELEVLGNTVVITDGDTSPSASDFTDFGTATQGGAVVSRLFVVRNNGTGNLTISGLTVPAGFTITDGLASTILPCDSESFVVQLDTATIGIKTGQITFNNNDADENPFNFTITGTVYGSEVAVLGNSINISNGDTTPSTADGTDFGAVALGGAPITRSFVVHNYGNSDLTTSGLSIPTGFTISDGLASVILPGTSDTVSVRLDTSIAGEKGGFVTFTNNDVDENPFGYYITGRVTIVEVMVTGNGHEISDGDTSPSTADWTDFGSVLAGNAPISRTFSVNNLGTSTLTTSGLSVPAGFSVVEGLASAIGPGAADTFTVQLDAQVVGTKTGQITFSNNDGDEHPYNFSVTGVVSASEVTVLGNNVSISDGDTTPSTADGTDFGSVALGGSPVSRVFIVRNDGNATLTTNSLSVPTGFTLFEGLAGSIAPGASDTFTVQMSTTSVGTKNGQITFNNNDVGESPFNFSITGTVTSPEVAVRGNSIDIPDGDTTPSIGDGTNFGSVVQNGSAPSRSFAVRNDGTSTLVTSGLSVPAGYVVTNGLASSIAAGAYDIITLELNSLSLGTKSGQVSFITNDSDENPFNFSITGFVSMSAAPEVMVEYDFGTSQPQIADGDTTPSTTDGTNFGNTWQGGFVPTRSFVITNVGTDDLTLTGLSVPAGFTIITYPAANLSPNTTTSFTVALDTQMIGIRSGPITFDNNDADEDPFDFIVTGNVTGGVPEVTVLGNGLNISDGDTSPTTSDGTDFGTVTQGGFPVTHYFTVRNDGTGTLTTSGLSVPYGFTVVDGLASSIAPFTTDIFSVQMDSWEPGMKGGYISFYNNDTTENPFNFAITGNVGTFTDVDLFGVGINAPTFAAWGQTLALNEIQLANGGGSDSGAFHVQFYLSQDTVGGPGDILLPLSAGQIWLYHPSIPGYQTGPWMYVNVVLPSQRPSGWTGNKFYIVMRTDAYNVVSETDEFNNFGQMGEYYDSDSIFVT